MMENIIVATIKEWNISNYYKLKDSFGDRYHFYLVTNKDELTEEFVNDLNPKYIFFPHWSWIIPKHVYENFESIVFHMTDLPFGRGGSPFQNLIIREIYDTKISALRVEAGLDTGNIYLKEDFDISTGSAEDNFSRLSNVIFEKMIPEFLNSKLESKKQVGDIVEFKRRTPQESDMSKIGNKSIKKIYDFVRMLDAEGYPKAYLELDDIRIEFSEANIKDGKLTGKFEVIENG